MLSHSPADVSVLKVDNGLEGYKSTVMQSLLGGAAGFMLGPVTAIIGGTAGLLLPMVKTVKAHTAFHFKDEPTQTPIKYELYCNDTKHGQAVVEKKLKNKPSLLQNPIVQGGMYFMHRVGKAASRVKKGIQSAFEPAKSTSLTI